MSKIQIKDSKGKAAGEHELSKSLTEATTSATSVHRAIVAEEANSRQGTQSAKTRSEVRGGGRKPYKQKKTGNARQGSIRSPHYAHGGMALAVKPRDYTKQINKKERRAAIMTALASQIGADNVTVVKEISFDEPKTKEAVKFLKAMGVDSVKRVLIILSVYDEIALKCLRNLPNVEVRTAPQPSPGGEAPKSQGFSARDVMVAHKIVVAQAALTKIEEVWGK